jgi:choline dehydrogenase-like flavoprotein
MRGELSADVVVVGSGVAGALIAHELARAGASVVILEAGPRIERSEILENYRNNPAKGDMMVPYPASRIAPHPEYKAYMGGPPNSNPFYRGDNNYLVLKGPDASAYAQQYIRIVGGTTWHWAAACWRFLPSDFRLKSLYGIGRDWPIAYDDLEPYYFRAEVELGVSGPNDGTDLGSPRAQPYPMNHIPLSYNDKRFAEILNANGFKVVSEPVARNSRPYDDRPVCCGNNSCMPICPIGAMYNGIIHVEKAERAGARLLDNAVVYRVEIDARDRVSAVLYKDRDGRSHRVTGKHFVLAANGVETPKLLLISADDRRPAGIANSSDQVGRNLMDHPGTGVTFLAREALWPGRGPIEMTSVINFRDGDFRKDYAAKKLHLGNQGQTRWAALRALSLGLTGHKLDQEIRRRSAHTVNINSFHEILPEPENRLVASRDLRDALGLPRPEVTYAIGEYMKRSGQHTRELYAEIARLMGGEDVNYYDRFFASSHIMGSVIMGASPHDSVVDGHCRTHDHENLYLATTGVMPSAGTVNCTLTLAALSLRLADTLRAQ